MSRRPQEAARGGARPEDPTRRLFLGGAATPLLLPGAAFADPAVTAVESWLARHSEIDRLTGRWGQLEAMLAREHNWFKLTLRQQARLPAAQELHEIDEQLELMQADQLIEMGSMPMIVATSWSGVLGKLAVAVVDVEEDEAPALRSLIASAMRDLEALIKAKGLR